MGKRIGSADDQADVHVEADLLYVGDATAWVEVRGNFNLVLTGTGTAQLESSFDGGVTAVPCGSQGAIVTLAAPLREALFSSEAGVLHRVRKTGGAGTLHARLSQ